MGFFVDQIKKMFYGNFLPVLGAITRVIPRSKIDFKTNNYISIYKSVEYKFKNKFEKKKFGKIFPPKMSFKIKNCGKSTQKVASLSFANVKLVHKIASKI